MSNIIIIIIKRIFFIKVSFASSDTQRIVQYYFFPVNLPLQKSSDIFPLPDIENPTDFNTGVHVYLLYDPLKWFFVHNNHDVCCYPQECLMDHLIAMKLILSYFSYVLGIFSLHISNLTVYNSIDHNHILLFLSFFVLAVVSGLFNS